MRLNPLFLNIFGFLGRIGTGVAIIVGKCLPYKMNLFNEIILLFV